MVGTGRAVGVVATGRAVGVVATGRAVGVGTDGIGWHTHSTLLELTDELLAEGAWHNIFPKYYTLITACL